MKDKAIKNLTITLLIFVGITFIYFLFSTAIDGYSIWGTNKIDFSVTGQFGDFIGGFLGTVINGAAFYFLYLTLNEQRKSAESQSFETRFYELIHLHRENVSELRYTKNNLTAESRKVFREIVEEFVECFHEVKRFSKIYPDIEILHPTYKIKLAQIAKANKCRANLEEIAIIDISFCCIYFGLSRESETILLHKFYHRYNKDFIRRLKTFLQLKPKLEDVTLFAEWKKFKSKEVKEMQEVFEKIYSNRKLGSLDTSSDLLFKNLSANKY